MPTVYKVLGQSNPAANTLTTLYAVPSSNAAVVSTMSICNQGAANANISIAIAQANTSVTATQYIVKDALITTNDTIFLTLGVTMAATDTIRINSTNANTSFAAFGSEIY
jgi:hypothetical protein